MKKYISLLLLLLVATPLMAADFNLEEGLNKFFNEMGFVTFFVQEEGWKNAVMILIGCFLLYLAIKKEYEPLLLLPIAFGMILSNLPGAGLFDSDMWNNEFLNPNSSARGGKSTTRFLSKSCPKDALVTIFICFTK